jgi:hypothetical protein
MLLLLRKAIYKKPELKFKVLFTSFDLFVRITSSKLGLEVPIKNVGALI